MNRKEVPCWPVGVKVLNHSVQSGQGNGKGMAVTAKKSTTSCFNKQGHVNRPGCPKTWGRRSPCKQTRGRQRRNRVKRDEEHVDRHKKKGKGTWLKPIGGGGAKPPKSKTRKKGLRGIGCASGNRPSEVEKLK